MGKPGNTRKFERLKQLSRYYAASVAAGVLVALVTVEQIRNTGDDRPKVDCRERMSKQLDEIKARREDGAWLTVWVRKPQQSDVIVTPQDDDRDIMRNPLVIRCGSPYRAR